jgi:NADPH:quinone reductase-like Zn-dependent oxidoreductase
MKAIVYTEYGSPDVLQLKEVETPAPKDDEVLVKTRAASVNPLDYHNLEGIPFLIRLLYRPARANGLRQPKDGRLGADIAGQVQSVGPGVTQFRPGEAVFGAGTGSFAEYAPVPEDRLALKPANLSFEEAAAVPVAAITALQGLRDAGQIRFGQKVLIQGASGGVGSFAVQIAKAFGADVTAVCSPRNADTARVLGADHVIDYTQADFTRSGQRYDLILAVNGYHPISAYRRALGPQGRYVLAGSSGAQLMQAFFEALVLGPILSRTGGQKLGFMGIAKIDQKDLVFLKELLETGKVVPVIDRCYPLAETADALRYLKEGHAKGKVIVAMG